MNKVQVIRKFIHQVANEKVIIAKERDQWSINVNQIPPRLILPKDLNENDETDKMFRSDFIRRYSSAQGFANITLSILHELGHHFTREIYLNADKYEGDTMEEHLTLLTEVVATEWAIQWLKNSINRKIAKAFEKEYFGY